MLNFLFKNKDEKFIKPDININEIYAGLKEIYPFNEIKEERKEYLRGLMNQYGYLPYPHIKALEELSEAETLFCLEFKWKNEKTFNGKTFTTSHVSPLARKNINDSDWIKKEGHDIKLINLAALGDGNKTKEAGKFIDWLKQLLILPNGNPELDIFPTTIYLIPFQERDFGCAYLPTCSDVSSKLEDKNLSKKLELNAKLQVQIFIMLAQLAGHPVIYDILPQTGRFSKMVLANPQVARWFDLSEFQKKLDNCIELVAQELTRKFDKEDIEIIKDIYKQKGCGDFSEDYKIIYDEFEKELNKLKKTNSKEMLKKDNQLKIQKKVKEIVANILGLKPNQVLNENDITKQTEIIQTLIKEGLWTAPGGAWCSAGVPVFDKMSECQTFPIFKHFDYKDKDVTEFANLDCQTPFYFVFLENGQYNQPVIDFFIKCVKNFQNEYNFDGIRIDHVDHVIDEVSVTKNGTPISYRIPTLVLNHLNFALKKDTPYFAAIAEYMLGGNFLREYHEEMQFDVLWGNDIPAQDIKTPEVIVDDNQNLAIYNTKNFKINDLSILKTYNNQDGEFSVIDRYPALLGKEGALFKWFKYKFLPGGKHAQRPVLYIDGDESFTQTGIEQTIGNEISMKRAKDYDFFAKFDAINRFAKSQVLLTQGEAQIILQEEDGFACWLISKEPLKSAFLIVANYLPAMERIFVKDEENGHFEIKNNESVFDKSINLPGDYQIKSEFILNDNDFEENKINTANDEIILDEVKPSEFKIYFLSKN